MGVVFIFLLLTPSIEGATLLEYQIKAAFIYNFLKFIDLPKVKENGTINVCIFGDDPFGKAIYLLEGKKVGNKTLHIKKIDEVKKISGCQVVFFPASQKDKLKEALEFAKKKPILTIGEVPHFLDMGGVINFVIIDGKIRFEINESIARELGIKISSRLLRLARQVK